MASFLEVYFGGSTFIAHAGPQLDALRLIFDKLQAAGKWVKANPEEAAKILAPVWGLTPEIVTLANSHRSYAVLPVKPENLVEVQKIADTFFAEGDYQLFCRLLPPHHGAPRL
jgi:sulfonate transport system substrate-binding protein